MPESTETAEPTIADLLTELQGIRALLERREQNEAMCPHGTTGVCMNCITPLVDFHLASLVNQVTNEAWAAMRRG